MIHVIIYIETVQWRPGSVNKFTRDQGQVADWMQGAMDKISQGKGKPWQTVNVTTRSPSTNN